MKTSSKLFRFMCNVTFIFCLFMTQTASAAVLLAGTSCPMASKSQNMPGKSGCCSAESKACTCELKQEEPGDPLFLSRNITTSTTDSPIFYSKAEDTDTAYNAPEKKGHAFYWLLARGPTTLIYLSNLSFIC